MKNWRQTGRSKEAGTGTCYFLVIIIETRVRNKELIFDRHILFIYIRIHTFWDKATWPYLDNKIFKLSINTEDFHKWFKIWNWLCQTLWPTTKSSSVGGNAMYLYTSNMQFLLRVCQSNEIVHAWAGVVVIFPELYFNHMKQFVT